MLLRRVAFARSTPINGRYFSLKKPVFGVHTRRGTSPHRPAPHTPPPARRAPAPSGRRCATSEPPVHCPPPPPPLIHAPTASTKIAFGNRTALRTRPHPPKAHWWVGEEPSERACGLPKRSVPAVRAAWRFALCAGGWSRPVVHWRAIRGRAYFS